VEGLPWCKAGHLLQKVGELNYIDRAAVITAAGGQGSAQGSGTDRVPLQAGAVSPLPLEYTPEYHWRQVLQRFDRLLTCPCCFSRLQAAHCCRKPAPPIPNMPHRAAVGSSNGLNCSRHSQGTVAEEGGVHDRATAENRDGVLPAYRGCRK
jgi:hypothetical protein